MAEILVIVVTFNAMQWIERCLGSIASSDFPADAMVVDNGSTDGTVEAVRRLFPAVRLVATGQNSGFGAANNTGLRAALDGGYRFAYLLNQDAWLEKDTLSKLIRAAIVFPDYGILSPLQKDASGRFDRNFERKCGKFLCEYAGAEIDISLSLSKGQFSKFQREGATATATATAATAGSAAAAGSATTAATEAGSSAATGGSAADAERNGMTDAGVCEVPFVMAAHWLLSREAIETVGGFSPSFRHYGEDDNYIHRLTFHGLRCGVVPDASAVHDRGGRKLSKDAKMRLKCTATVVRVSRPEGSFFLHCLAGVVTLAGMSVRNLSLKPLLFIPTLLGRIPELRRNRRISLGKGAFLQEGDKSGSVC